MLYKLVTSMLITPGTAMRVIRRGIGVCVIIACFSSVDIGLRTARTPIYILVTYNVTRILSDVNRSVKGDTVASCLLTYERTSLLCWLDSVRY